MSFGIVAAVVSVVSTVGQYMAASDAADAQRQSGEAQAAASERQYQAQQKAADIQNVRSIRNSIREARAKRALILNSGAVGNTMGSSGVMGGMASVGSQATSNINFVTSIGEAQKEERQAVVEGGRAAVAGASAVADAQLTGAAWGALGQLGGTIFSNSDKISKAFK